MKCFRVARWRYLWHLRNPTCWAVLGSKWKALLLSQLQHWWQVSLRVTQLLELGPEAPQAEQSACITGLISYRSCDAGRTATPNDTSTFYTQFHFVSVEDFGDFSRPTEATYSARGKGRRLPDACSTSPEPPCFYNLKAVTFPSC